MKTIIKQTIKPLAVLSLLMMIWACNSQFEQTEDAVFQAQELFPEPPRPEGQTDVLELRCDPIDTVRVAFIGVGSRGSGAVRRFTFLDG